MVYNSYMILFSRKPLMKYKTRRDCAFTLIEVMVIVIIVGILAVAATPIYSRHMMRTRLSEAVAGLGAIRSAQRLILIETGSYVNVAPEHMINEPTDQPRGLGLDFRSNSYYDDVCFEVVDADENGFIARATGNAEGSTAHRRMEVDKMVIEMRENGDVRHSFDGGVTWSGWK